MKHTLIAVASSLSLALAVGACGDDTSRAGPGGSTDNLVKPDGSACGQSGRSGETQCGDFDTCAAGQYCADQRFGSCENGCLSDNNCAANQFCDIDGSGNGICRNCIVQQPQPAPDPTPNPNPSNQVTTCAQAGDAFQACGYSAADVTAFVFQCNNIGTDFQNLIFECLSRASGNCTQVQECAGDDDDDGFQDDFEFDF